MKLDGIEADTTHRKHGASDFGLGANSQHCCSKAITPTPDGSSSKVVNG
jgi:hypothetical protein